MERIIRYAMKKNVYLGTSKEIVTHTAANMVLAEDSQMADEVGAKTDELWQVVSQTLMPW